MLRLLPVLALALSACAPVSITMLEPAWDPMQRQPYERVLVVGAADAELRTLFERVMARRTRGAGVEAVPSHELFEDTPSEEVVRAAVAEGAFDAVLVTRVVSVDRSYRYEEGATFTSLSIDPIYEGSAFGGALPLRSTGAVYPWVRESVTLGEGWEEQTEVTVESTLFRTRDGVPTWHARFNAVDPRSARRGVRASARAVVDGIRRVGQLPLEPGWP